MNNGTFIVVEGPEGVGKSTAFRRLSAMLEADGYSVLASREPGGTSVGEDARTLALHTPDLNPLSELFLMLAARAAMVEEVVRPALEKGQVVLLDRFSLSTYVYQGVGRGISFSDIEEANRIATGGLHPDLTIVLSAPEHVRAQRMGSRGGPGDQIERAGQEFHRKVAESYERSPSFYLGAKLVDASGSEEEVALAAFEAAKQVLPSIRRRSVRSD